MLESENLEDCRKLLGITDSVDSNIVGYTSFFRKYKHELETRGMTTAWFTISSADLHWSDLTNLLCKNALPVLESSAAKAKFKRKLVRDNPHIVDPYIYERVGVSKYN